MTRFPPSRKLRKKTSPRARGYIRGVESREEIEERGATPPPRRTYYELEGDGRGCIMERSVQHSSLRLAEISFRFRKSG